MSKDYKAHEDRFTPRPDEYESAICGVCNTIMDVRRNVHGPTGWAEAMSKSGHLHDEFGCPHTKEKWHIQVKALKQKADREICFKIEEILLGEASTILRTRQETKDIGSGNWR